METIPDPSFPLIRLPADFRSQRQTTRVNIDAGSSIDLLAAEGPGCVRHLWLAISASDWPRPDTADGVELEICADGDTQVRMALDHFFGVLLGQGPPYRLESAGIKILPDNAYNLYLPVPFRSGCRITLRTPKWLRIFAMVDWQRYAPSTPVTALRLHARFRQELPAQDHGSFLIGDIAGAGFVAGIIKGVRQQDTSDVFYHTGGATWLMDGESDPHALRGINEEDDFNFSFGYRDTSSQWTGCPYVVMGGAPAPEAVAYRFFGPDPIRFRSSLVARAGSRADDTETILYYYRDADSTADEVGTPAQWQLAGPFPCDSHAVFRHPEPPEQVDAEWPADAVLNTEHTWLDLTRHFDTAESLLGVAAYARTTVTSEAAQDATIRIGFDDWLTLWVNGRECASLRHDHGFAVARIAVTLAAGDNELLVKLSNDRNVEYRLWAFSCVIE